MGLVHELESLTQRAERHRVLADDVPGAEGVDADLLLRALAREPLPAVHGHLVEIAPERPGDDLRHAQRGAARRVFLEPVVGLGDLDVVLVAERPGHGGEELERDVGGDGHVGRHDYCRPPRELADFRALGGGEAGRADHRPGTRLRDEPQVRERGIRDGELDQHAVARDQRGGVRLDRDAGLAHARELAGVAAERRMAGGLERSDQPEIGRVGEARDDATAHPAGGAGNNDTRRRGASAPDVRGCLPVGDDHGAAT